MKKFHLANEKRRDAEIGYESKKPKPLATYVLRSGKAHSGVRLLKGTFATEFDALVRANADVAAALEAGDPEIDMEQEGRKLEGLGKVYVSADGQVVYSVSLSEHVYAPDGTEKDVRPPAETPANVAVDDMPIRCTGKLFPKAEALRKFVFVRSYQLHHVNGLTYDFLFEIAKKLDEAKAMMLVGGGEKGAGPLVFSNNGTAYRGFLEGRVQGEKYMLILRLTNLELKEIPNV